MKFVISLKGLNFVHNFDSEKQDDLDTLQTELTAKVDEFITENRADVTALVALKALMPEDLELTPETLTAIQGKAADGEQFNTYLVDQIIAGKVILEETTQDVADVDKLKKMYGGFSIENLLTELDQVDSRKAEKLGTTESNTKGEGDEDTVEIDPSFNTDY